MSSWLNTFELGEAKDFEQGMGESMVVRTRKGGEQKRVQAVHQSTHITKKKAQHQLRQPKRDLNSLTQHKKPVKRSKIYFKRKFNPHRRQGTEGVKVPKQGHARVGTVKKIGAKESAFYRNRQRTIRTTTKLELSKEDERK